MSQAVSVYHSTGEGSCCLFVLSTASLLYANAQTPFRRVLWRVISCQFGSALQIVALQVLPVVFLHMQLMHMSLSLVSNAVEQVVLGNKA